MLVVVHNGAAPRADLGIAVGQRDADQADVRRKGGVDVLVQRLRDHESSLRMRSATCGGVSTACVLRSMTPTITLFGASAFSTARSSRGCAASIEICEARVSASW